MIYGFGFFKVNYLKFSLKFVNYYFITNLFWPSLSKFFPTYPFCTFPPGMNTFFFVKQNFWQQHYGSNFHLILTLSTNFLYTVCTFFPYFLKDIYLHFGLETYVRVLKTTVILVNWKGKSREYPKSTSFTPPRRNFHLDGCWL